MDIIIDAVFKFMIYEPIWKIVLICVGLDVLWIIMNIVTKNHRKIRKIINIILLVLTLIMVFWITLLSRHPGVRDYCIKPFILLQQAKDQPTIYRSVMMNIFLFIPIGISVPGIVSQKGWYRNLMVVLGCLAVSSFVEIMQFLYCLGRAEVDDVIANTLGALIGVTLYYVNKGIVEKSLMIKSA